MDRTISGATNPGQRGPRSDSNKGILHISPKIKHYWNLTIRLFSVISRNSFGGSFPSTEKQSVYSTAPANWANFQLLLKMLA